MELKNNELYKQILEDDISLSTCQLSPEIFNPFWDDFLIRFCWSSNAMEGNTLSLDETVELLMYDEVQANHSYQEYVEAKNLYHAVKKNLSVTPVEITDEWIQKCNALIRGMNQSDYRKNDDIYIGTMVEAVYYPPSHDLIKNQIEQLLNALNQPASDFENLIKEAAALHIKFERIHPFKDGNGRTGRLILNQQLINNGILPVCIEKKSKYRQAFRIYDRNGDTALLEHLILNAEIDNLKRINELQRKKAASQSEKIEAPENEPEI